MNDWRNLPPGSPEYATAYWSSPEGKRRFAEIEAQKAPPPPDPREAMSAALAKHDKALRRWAFSPLGTPKPAGVLTDEALEDMQAAYRVLDGDPLSQNGRADAVSAQGWGDRFAETVPE